ncbi:ABC transporter permease [Mycetocola reblochoni]|uniref:Ribose ABC transport system, permease protein RbsC (TC 3.A.1.2.1) n=2 Tax=Mycetocola reblochoni TaxID=331618 RepID=A0A1R4IHD9_9MICO|nr:ABC transporter permease [Mycetocola reblochoni]RLP69686.1 ABC transporter permease [Mycetocola reblochoni]SJN19158.1 Ribose ABC transport system, permease protein RbsC (TC 3.A.1.2.1) [Mycetocola reblochoni REB411]
MTRILGALRTSSTPAIVLFAVTFALTAVVNPRFLSPVGQTNFFGSYLPLVLVAMAMAVIMVTGGIDLSLGAVMTLVNVVFITLVGHGVPVVLAVAAGVLAALAVGAVNGLLVSAGRIPPLLATLGTMFVVNGICLTVMPVSGGSAPTEMVAGYASGIAYIPVALIAVVAAIAAWVVFSRTKLSLRMYAVGGDATAAYASGLAVPRVTWLSYVIGAGIASVAAMALTANVATGGPDIAGTYTMSAIAAAVIGGVALSGGTGSPVGAVFGALFLGLISNLVLSLGISSYFVSAVTGAVVLAGIVLTSLVRRDSALLSWRRTAAPQSPSAQEGAPA